MVSSIIELNQQEVAIISGGGCNYVFRCSINGDGHGECGLVLVCS